jgi:raffinose/stachyose/melibiose transport system substrate-binding protein
MRRTLSTALCAMAAATALAVTACGSSGPSSSATGQAGTPSSAGSASSGATAGGATGWALTQGSQATFQYSQKEWNGSHPQQPVSLQYYSNDAYKQKLQVAMGANSVPTLFENWGGGALGTYVTAGKVAALPAGVTSAASQEYFKSVLNAATFGGKLYGIPVNGTQPVVLFYNKTLFAKVGAQPPKTWADLLALVAKFKAAGIAPLALGGSDQWPELMYLEYLADRVGGPSVAADITNGKSGAWSNPAVLKAATMISQLVSAGAFENGYAAVSYDSGASSALLYTGKAAMQLMGSWDFSTIQTADASFISGGDLGWTTFPTVAGGAGDPADIVGNLSNYFSVTTASAGSAQTAAESYLTSEVGSSAYVKNLLAAGNVPPIAGLDSQLSAEPSPNWLLFQYHLVQAAPSYQLSWDQAMASTSEATAMLTNLSLLFTGKQTPQQFVAAMNQAAA